MSDWGVEAFAGLEDVMLMVGFHTSHIEEQGLL